MRGLSFARARRHDPIASSTHALRAPSHSLHALGLTKSNASLSRPLAPAVRAGSQVIEDARNEDVAFLVIGDPFGATTHSDLYLRALKLGVKVEVVHNASIMNACGACGLQLYRFGETISIVFFTETWRHGDSFYDKVLRNNNGSKFAAHETSPPGLAKRSDLTH